MANKIRFGLSGVKYALKQQSGYASPVAWPGAVSLSLSREGGDSTDFYADNGVYYTFGGTNGGYSGDLEMAYMPDAVRVALLNEVADSASGAQFETTASEAPEFALICEMQGDSGPIAFVFYGCKASRPELQANTKGESPSVDTSTLNIRIAGDDFTYDGNSKHFIQGHIEKTDSNTAKYNAFLAAVAVPGSTGGTGL